MKLISITHTPVSGKIMYDFIFNNEVRTYSAYVSDSGGIRGLSYEPDLEALLLEAQKKNNNAVKILVKVTLDLIDGVDVSYPIVL